MNTPLSILNKFATVDFKVEEKLEAGIVLLGSEVKAVKQGHADINGSHIKIIGNEAFLVNTKIFPYKFSRVDAYEESRMRKLLLHKKELLSLRTKLTQGNYTIIPTKLYTTNGLIKIQIAIAKGKKQYEHKADIKKRDIDRDIAQELKRFK